MRVGAKSEVKPGPTAGSELKAESLRSDLRRVAGRDPWRMPGVRTEVCVGTGPGCAAGLSPEARSGAKSLAYVAVGAEECAGTGPLAYAGVICGVRAAVRSVAKSGKTLRGREIRGACRVRAGTRSAARSSDLWRDPGSRPRLTFCPRHALCVYPDLGPGRGRRGYPQGMCRPSS